MLDVRYTINCQYSGTMGESKLTRVSGAERTIKARSCISYKRSFSRSLASPYPYSTVEGKPFPVHIDQHACETDNDLSIFNYNYGLMVLLSTPGH
jgi:hypothetical protein